MKILILGSNGMLGHMVKKYLELIQYEIETIEYRWPSKEFKAAIIDSNADILINCVGAIKKRARDFIVGTKNKTKILKASIIGPELNSQASLLEWFLNSENKVSGYSKAMWNGVTTLEWAKQCKLLIEHWHSYKVETILYSECISKYDLLSSIKSIFNKDIKISKNISYKADKCLTGDISTPSIKIQLFELLNFYYDN